MIHRRISRRIGQLAIASLLTFSLSGCAMTWQKPLTCAAIGGGLGAIGGGIGGAEHADGNDDWEGAMIAVGSTVVGAGLGYLVCHLIEDEPKSEPSKAAASDSAETSSDPEPVPVLAAAPAALPAPDPCEQVVRLDGVNFASDRADIQPEARQVLNATVETLESCREKRVRVEAYTDSSGPTAYNEALSQRRADSVRKYLIDGGIAADRIEAVGRGEADPIASNETRDGRARNRRVELEPID